MMSKNKDKLSEDRSKLSDKIKSKLPNTYDNYIIINIGYRKFILKYDDGIKAIVAFRKVEIIDDKNWKILKVKPMDEEHAIEIKVISKEEYLKMKMNTLLNIN